MAGEMGETGSAGTTTGDSNWVLRAAFSAVLRQPCSHSRIQGPYWLVTLVLALARSASGVRLQTSGLRHARIISLIQAGAVKCCAGLLHLCSGT